MLGAGSTSRGRLRIVNHTPRLWGRQVADPGSKRMETELAGNRRKQLDLDEVAG
jgi:hypothetical protein